MCLVISTNMKKPELNNTLFILSLSRYTTYILYFCLLSQALGVPDNHILCRLAQEGADVYVYIELNLLKQTYFGNFVWYYLGSMCSSVEIKR